MSSELKKAVSTARAIESQLQKEIASVESQIDVLGSEFDKVNQLRESLRVKRQDALADGGDLKEIDRLLSTATVETDRRDLHAGLTRKLARLSAALEAAVKERKGCEKALSEHEFREAVDGCRKAMAALKTTMTAYRSARADLSDKGGFDFAVDSFDVDFRGEIIALKGELLNQ